MNITKHVNLLCALVLMLVMVGCGNKEVSIVKEGTLDFDKTLTVGKAIDNYKYFKKVDWKLEQSENGKRVVVVSGDLEVEKILNEFRAFGKDKNISLIDVLSTVQSLNNPGGLSMVPDILPEVKSAKLEFEFLINTDNSFKLGWYGYRIEMRNGDKSNPPTNSKGAIQILEEIYSNKFLGIASEIALQAPMQSPAKKVEAPANPKDTAIAAANAKAQAENDRSAALAAQGPAAINAAGKPASPAPSAIPNNQNSNVYVDIIKNFIAAEDRRDIATINNYLSEHMERYWDISSPLPEQIYNRYQHVWSITAYSKNQILHIEKQNETTYVLFTRYQYEGNRQHKVIAKDNRVVFVFDNDMKITQIYGLD